MKILETLIRVYVDPDTFIKTIDFYEKLFNKHCHLQFKYAKYRLELAAVGSVLIIAGDKKHREPFETTKITCHVDKLSDFYNKLLNEGARILEEPSKVPTGTNMRVQHPDGMIVEYVEHD